MTQDNSLTFNASVHSTTARHGKLKQRRIRQRNPKIRQLYITVEAVFKVFDSLLTDLRLEPGCQHTRRNHESGNNS